MGGRVRWWAQRTTGLRRYSSALRSPAGTTTSPARSGSTVLMTARTTIWAGSTTTAGSAATERVRGAFMDGLLKNEPQIDADERRSDRKTGWASGGVAARD